MIYDYAFVKKPKTDLKHIKFAFEQLDLDANILDRIDYYDFGKDKTLGDELDDLLVKLSNMPRNNIIIGIFDRDKHVREPDKGKAYIAMKNNVFRFNIPALENNERQLESKICIEHYYSDAEIETSTDFGHLYMAKDFNEFGVSTDGHLFFQNYSKNNSLTPISIIDSSNKHLQKLDGEARILSKDDFADYVINHPLEFNFDNFRKIFDIISSIVADMSNAHDELI